MLKDPAVIGAIMSSPQALQALVSQLQAAQVAIDQSSMTGAACVAVVYADLLMTLPREIKYIWRADWSVLKVLYLCLRYYCTFYSSFLLWMLFGNWTTDSCKPAFHMVPFLGMFEYVLSHSIMILRTWTVWNRSKPILAVCGALLLLEIGIVSWVSWDVGMAPILGNTGPCVTMSVNAKSILYYVPQMIMDLGLTTLTLYKCLGLFKEARGLGRSTRTGRLVQTIISQCLHYFFIITALNILSTIWTIAKINSPQQALTGQVTTAASMLMTLHLAIDLKTQAYQNAQSNTLATISSVAIATQKRPDAVNTEAGLQDKEQYELRPRTPSL